VYYRLWKYFLGSFPNLKTFTHLTVQPGSTAVHSEGARNLPANTTMKSDLEIARKKLADDNEAFKNLELRVYEARKAPDPKTGIIYTKLKKVEDTDVELISQTSSMSDDFIGEVTNLPTNFLKVWRGLGWVELLRRRYRAIDFGFFGSSPCHFALIDSFLIIKCRNMVQSTSFIELQLIVTSKTQLQGCLRLS
jgi:hypothetical protein